MGRVLAALGVAAILAFAIIACGESGGSVSTPAAAATEAPSAAASPTATSSTGTPDGAQLFADDCSGCHAGDGSGGQGPDIRNATDVAAITNQVEDGGAGMPSFAGTLTPPEIQAVAEYVATKL